MQVPGIIAPVNGTAERNALQDLLSFISIELEYSIEGLFDLSLDAEVHSYLRSIAVLALAYMEELLEGDRYGDKFFIYGRTLSIADCYLYSILCCISMVGIDIESFPRLHAYAFRMANLPEVAGAEARIAAKAITTC